MAKDPVADSTDLYAFVSPDRADTVTMVANYLPFEYAPGGPNFYEFGDDVLYRINIDNDGDGRADIIYQFQFTTTNTNPNTFLYNTGQITSLSDPDWNRRQSFSVTRLDLTGNRTTRRTVLASGLSCPPCNVGVRSTPNYASLAAQAIYSLDGGIKVFCGQRLDPFYADLGPIFDLGTLRPFQNLHLIPSAAAAGINSLRTFGVHSIVIQVPKTQLTASGGAPTNVADSRSVIGVWTSASRRKALVRDNPNRTNQSGPFVQVSRLGNPLFNEVIIPLPVKDYWNKTSPHQDSQFAQYGLRPELAKLLPVLYPGVFPNLANYNKDRADLAAILLTGIPNGVVPGFQNYTGPVIADMLRLNMAIGPTASPNNGGLVAGDAAGFPNGRRLADDVVTIELRAVAGATIPLVDPTFTPDAAAGAITQGVKISGGNVSYLNTFPYVGTPKSGTEVTPPRVP